MQRAGAEHWTHSLPEWCSGHWSHQRGQGAPQKCSLCPSVSPLGQCAGVRTWCEVTEVTEEETEAFGAAMWACLPESCRALLYSLQILTGDVPSAITLGMSATTQLKAIADRGLVPAPPTPSVSGTLASQVGAKCQHHSLDQGAPTLKGLRQDEEEAADIDEVSKECPCSKCKKGNALK